MRENVIFEMTKSHLENNLHQIPVGYCHTSYIDAKKGVFYSTKALSEVAFWDVSKVIYLLKSGLSPTEKQLQTLKDELKKAGKLQDKTIQAILALPKDIDPLSMLAMALHLLKEYEPIEKPQDIIAKLPHVVSLVILQHAGWGDPMIFDQSLDYVSNFVQMLKQKQAVADTLLPLLDLIMVVYMDHGGGALDAFVAKASFSSKQDIIVSLIAALQAFQGDLFGKASQHAYRQLKEVYGQLQGEKDEQKLQSYFEDILNRGQIIYGFGHPTFSMEDPRATLLYHFAQKHYTHHPYVPFALACRQVIPQILKKKSARCYANGDAIVGTLLAAVGFDHDEYFPLLLFMARSIGMIIQLEQEADKKRRIFSPTYFYKAKL